MIFSKIWERYFIKEASKVFLLFLLCFYGLYILIDYASHTSSFTQSQAQMNWKNVISYYVYIFITKAEILIPIGILISTVKTLCTFNTHNELIALMASGIKLKTLLRPFFIMSLFLVSALYINEEFLLPHALKKLRLIEDANRLERIKGNPIASVKHIQLNDNSTILYQFFDSAREMFFDVYWIRSIDEIYRIKYLSPTEIPEGHFVDHIVRNNEGAFETRENFKMKLFPDIQFNQEQLLDSLIPSEELSLTELYKKWPLETNSLDEKDSRLLSKLYWRMIIPWLCLVAFIGPAPFCIKNSRTLKVFFIYVGSLFGLITFYLIMGSFLILAEHQVISPLPAILVPFLIVLMLFSYRYKKI